MNARRYRASVGETVVLFGCPVKDEYFYMGVMPEPCDQEVYFAFIRGGRIESRGGKLASSW